MAVLCALAGAAPLLAAPAPPAFPDRAAVLAAAASVTSAAFPDADEVVVEELVYTQYEPDGTAVSWDDEYVKVLTEKGKRNRTSLNLGFNLPYDTTTVIVAEILRPDGAVIPVDLAAQTRVMVSPDQMEKNIYDPNQKTLTVGIPGLAVGDLLHVRAREDTFKPRVPDAWSGYTVFEQSAPIRHLVYAVSAPKGRPLRSQALKAQIPGTVTRTETAQGDRILHRWEVRDTPRLFAEPNMPPFYTVVQRLLLSTTATWPELSRWYWRLCLPHLEAVNDGMRAKVRELTAGAGGRDGTIRNLFKFVSQQVRYMGVTTETEAPGYEPHDVCLTFDNRHGVCRDKAALLVAMLRLAGVDAYPVIIYTGPLKDEEVPQPFFDHAIVATRNADGSYALMDPTDEQGTDRLPGYLCNKSYLVAHPDGETLRASPITPAEDNLLLIRTVGRLDAAGRLTARSTLRFEGINDNAYRAFFSRGKPIERRRYFEGLVKRRAGGAALTGFRLLPEDMQDTGVPLTAELEFEATDYPVSGAGRALLPVPRLGASVGFVNFVLGRTGLPKRRFPLVTETACGVRETVEIDVSAYSDRLLDTPVFTGAETRSLSFRPALGFTNGVLRSATEFMIHTVEFSPGQYAELKRCLKDIEVDQRRAPILAQAADVANHDVVTLRSDVRYNVTGPRAWTETETVRQRILTYAGKKDHAELKIAFNPALETVRLRHARVTGTNGTVRAVAASETNLMDAAWVGSAPRYPAERTLVVSLPGVEVGSVIEYALEREVRDAPFFSISATFAGTEPVLTNRLEVAVPEALQIAVMDETGAAVTRTESAANGQRVRVWQAVGQTVLPREESQPPLWTFQPTVWLSAGAWPAYAQRVGSALERAAADGTNAWRLARQLTAAAPDAPAKIRILRDHAARTLRRAGPAFCALPLECLTGADRTLAEGYGHDADTAVALYALLKAAGFKVRFVLSSDWAPRAPALCRALLGCPQKELFDTVLVAVTMPGGEWYLNDTDQYAEPGVTTHAGRPALDLDGRCATITAPAGMLSEWAVEYVIRLDARGDARIDVRQTFAGEQHAEFHKQFAELPPEERRRTYLELLGEVSQAAEAETELTTVYAPYPGVMTFCARVPRYAVRTGAYLALNLPGSVPDLAPLRADRRTTPLYRIGPLNVNMRYSVILPPEYPEVVFAPRDCVWQAPAGLGTVASRTRVAAPSATQGTTITLERTLTLNSTVVPAEDYPSLSALNRRLKHAESATVLLRAKTADAPAAP